jgi:hypothetical protein
MARTITVLCDRHLGDGERVEGREVPVWGDRVLALCEECEVELYKPLADLVDEFGIRQDGKATRPYKKRKTAEEPGETSEEPGALVCVLCGEDHGPRMQRLRDHTRRAHGRSLAELYGDACPVCGKDGNARLGSHIVRWHSDLGIVNSPQAFAWAADHGDPHGIVAAVRRAAS